MSTSYPYPRPLRRRTLTLPDGRKVYLYSFDTGEIVAGESQA